MTNYLYDEDTQISLTEAYEPLSYDEDSVEFYPNEDGTYSPFNER